MRRNSSPGTEAQIRKQLRDADVDLTCLSTKAETLRTTNLASLGFCDTVMNRGFATEGRWDVQSLRDRRREEEHAVASYAV